MAYEVLSEGVNNGEIIHDGKLSFYGNLLATASSDNKVRIYDVSSGEHILLQEFETHSAPVYCVHWSHPRFGHMLVSGGYDGQIFTYSQKTSDGPFESDNFSLDSLLQSINDVKFAPVHLGLRIAAAVDRLAFLDYDESSHTWIKSSFRFPFQTTVYSIDWCPCEGYSLIACGLGDGKIAIVKAEKGNSEVFYILESHEECVTSVSWSGIYGEALASCSEDGKLLVWEPEIDGGKESEDAFKKWKPKQVAMSPKYPYMSVSFNPSCTFLAATKVNTEVELFQLDHKGNFVLISQNDVTNDNNVQASSPFENLR